MLLGKDGRSPRLNSFIFFFLSESCEPSASQGGDGCYRFFTQCIYGQTATTSKQIELGAAAATSIL